MSKINETNYPRRTQASYEDTDMLVIQESGGNTYTTRIEDLREDCQETLAPALNTMRENLATVEGSTASKAYAKGDFLVFGGRLCKAKTSIASGATLVLDTNIELDSVGDELSSLTSDLAAVPKVLMIEESTPSDHYNYVDISRTQAGVTYNRIVASIANNYAGMICAFTYNSSTFRIIVRDYQGQSASTEVKINAILMQ